MTQRFGRLYRRDGTSPIAEYAVKMESGIRNPTSSHSSITELLNVSRHLFTTLSARGIETSNLRNNLFDYHTDNCGDKGPIIIYCFSDSTLLAYTETNVQPVFYLKHSNCLPKHAFEHPITPQASVPGVDHLHLVSHSVLDSVLRVRAVEQKHDLDARSVQALVGSILSCVMIYVRLRRRKNRFIRPMFHGEARGKALRISCDSLV